MHAMIASALFSSHLSYKIECVSTVGSINNRPNLAITNNSSGSVICLAI